MKYLTATLLALFTAGASFADDAEFIKGLASQTIYKLSAKSGHNGHGQKAPTVKQIEKQPKTKTVKPAPKGAKVKTGA